MPPVPRALLLDYGGTLVEEVAFDTRRGIDVLLAAAEESPDPEVIASVLERAERVTRDVADRRDNFQIETPWASLTRLIHHPCGIRFHQPLGELEIPFWDACARTRPMPGAFDALREFQRLGLPLALVSNSSFGAAVLRHELAKHDLAGPLSAVVTSAEYAVRKPNPLLFETAALVLGVDPRDAWVIGDRLDTDIAGAHAAGMHGVHYSPSPIATRAEAFTWPEIVRLVERTVHAGSSNDPHTSRPRAPAT